MNHFALITSILIVTIVAFCWIEYGKPLLTMLGLQDDKRDH